MKIDGKAICCLSWSRIISISPAAASYAGFRCVSLDECICNHLQPAATVVKIMTLPVNRKNMSGTQSSSLGGGAMVESNQRNES